MSSRLPIEHERVVRAAEGWLELGDTEEARCELDRLAPEFKGHLLALAVRWRLHRRCREWEACLETAARLVQLEPQSAEFWRWFAESQSETALGAAAAKQTLLECMERFPTDGYVVYDLACYCARLGEADAAREWLRQGLKLVRAVSEKAGENLKAYAFTDPDLALLWVK